MRPGYVYIMTNHSQSSVYVGVTSEPEQRIAEHKAMSTPGFTATYKCVRLVLIEELPDMTQAIRREKQLKKWSRAKKDWLIAQENPEWRDLAEDWYS